MKTPARPEGIAINLDAPSLIESDMPKSEQKRANLIVEDNLRWSNPDIKPILLKPEYSESWIVQGYIGGKIGVRSGYRNSCGAISTIVMIISFLIIFFFNFILKIKIDWLLLVWVVVIGCLALFPDYYFLLIQKPRENHLLDIIPLIILAVWMASTYIGDKFDINWINRIGYWLAGLSVFFMIFRPACLKKINQVIKCLKKSLVMLNLALYGSTFKVLF